MRYWLYAFLSLVVQCPLLAQPRDSLYYELQEVEVTGVSRESVMRLTSSEGIITREELDQLPSYSLLPALNLVPGVRMEERSPGSYRLSIRGSLLRSPFGVRNVRIYLSEFPFTDAGGNTYLNSLDIGTLTSLRVIKGPEATVFGANTGGVLLIDPAPKTSAPVYATASVSGGAYGLFQENTSLYKQHKNISFYFNQGFQRADGYRDHSAMRRWYGLTGGDWKYSKKMTLKLLLLYSDLKYQTPGGLTLQQYHDQPSMARPATLVFPGAAEQNASVLNRTVLGGISHHIALSSKISHVISVFGSRTDFQNPFITNYEHRIEQTQGVRTYLEYTAGEKGNVYIRWNAGGEWQQTHSGIRNYGNAGGKKDTIMASDEIKATQTYFFAKFLADIGKKFLAEFSGSYNLFGYRYRTPFPLMEDAFLNRSFTPAFMPRAAVSYKLFPLLTWRLSVSSGYSSPTLAEVRSSDNVVNTSLQAERSQNYETGFRFRDRKDVFSVDLSAFYYTLYNAIVRRVDVAGNEYFVNAGNTRQPGLEGQVGWRLLKPRDFGFVRSIEIKGNISFQPFAFGQYVTGPNDYSGHRLTGVPRFTSMETISLKFPALWGLYVSYYYAGAIPLNDANTVYTNEYHLLQARIEWKRNIGKVIVGFFAGGDNLLNQKYSLGNDLNAAGGRYYNAAAPVNFYAGLKAVI